MKKIMVLGISVLACLGGSLFGTEPVRTVDLRCESMTNPLGVDETKPHLSWRLESEHPGEKQTAYHVLVASSPDGLDKGAGDLWDSGKVDSGQSIHVAYTGKPLSSKVTYYWKVRTWDKEGRPGVWSESANWTMGFLNPEDWSAQWIGPPPSELEQSEVVLKKAIYKTVDDRVRVDVTEKVREEFERDKQFDVHFNKLGGDPAPREAKEMVVEYEINGKPAVASVRGLKMLRLSTDPGEPAYHFRKEFDLAAVPGSAKVTVNSAAYFELYINGAKVGKDVLTPAVPNVDYQTFYVTYDVSKYLREGKNCMGLWLGKGWAKRIEVRAQLDAVAAGKRVTVNTDTSWKTHKSGMYKIGGWKWNDFGGEHLDARKLIPGWSNPQLDTSSWKAAVATKGPEVPVSSQICPLNRIGEEIVAVSVKPISHGRYEIDFGKALTGWLRFKMPKLEPGTVITMTFADVRHGPNRYQDFNQVSKFVSAGRPGEVFEHKFNYAGFRYVLIAGLPSAPAKEDAMALLIDSDLDFAGSFECSNELFNRIHAVNKWTQRALNLGGYYVDCPHRERMGYGDGQVAVEGFMTSFRADRFYRKWLEDWRSLQKPNGGLPNSTPLGLGGGGPGWGGIISAISWRHYLYYGDRRILQENYDAIRRYVDHLESICKDDVLRKYGGQWAFIGDWVAPRREMGTNNWPSFTAAELFNNCYRINQMELLKQMALVLNKPDDVARYTKRLAEIRPKVHAAFYDAKKKEYVIDEQAYYIMPLMTGVVPESERAALLKKLEKNILDKNKGHLDTGMLGTYFMMEYLRETGRNDLVFTMFSQTTYPSWGHMLAKGATTLWEQWNGGWSQIHSCFTSPDNWFYQGLAGIQADPEAPGLKNVIIKPEFVGDPPSRGSSGVAGLTWVKAHHDSPYGRIVSNWKREGELVIMDVAIPPNSTATVYVPAKTDADVTVNGQQLSNADHVTFLRMEGDRAVLKVGSGKYIFSSVEH